MKKQENILQFTALVFAIILANLWADKLFFRLDLTQEKRYSIAEHSKTVLQNLEDVVTVQVFLEGDLNADFKRLRNAVQENLDEFRIYAGDNIQYQFINPDEASSEKERNLFFQQLVEKGMQPTNLYENVEGKKMQKIIFPYALLTYQGREIPVLLLKGNLAVSAKEKLNQSVESIEYELITAIKNLSQSQKPAIAFVEGHEELDAKQTEDLTETLSQSYAIDRVNLQHTDLSNYQAVIIAQPKKPYTELEKYKLDQFIMHGGKALFFIDAVQLNIDSIPLGGAYAFGYDLGVDDLLFRYGVRVNQDLMQDLLLQQILVNVGRFGNEPNLQAIPFPYHILFNKFANHPTVKNLNAISGRLVSTIDTVKADKVKKTPLIFGSQYMRVRKMPNLVTFEELKADLDKNMYAQKFLPMLYLLEGEFTSLYKNRVAPDNSVIKKESVPTKIIVCSDGDLLRNDINTKTKQVLPLGFDQINGQTYANKELLQNLLAYLVEEQGVIVTRNKEIALRPLDELRIKEEKLTWQIINILLPIFAIISFGIIRYYWRKRKYGQK
jgi:gliding-associated putative ABC transporter substrate-binding component GldG